MIDYRQQIESAIILGCDCALRQIAHELKKNGNTLPGIIPRYSAIAMAIGIIKSYALHAIGESTAEETYEQIISEGLDIEEDISRVVRFYVVLEEIESDLMSSASNCESTEKAADLLKVVSVLDEAAEMFDRYA